MIIAGTGHRPKFLPCKYNENHMWFVNLKANLFTTLVELQPTKVISGMAIGWDTWLAEASLELNIAVSAYVPFKGQGSKWPEFAQKRYKGILEAASEVKYLSEKYTPQAFFIRDEAMIDDCDQVLALWNPEIQSGGTFHTVQYALQHNKPLINMWR